MKQISAREANQRFSKLLAEVAEGREVVITRRGKPVARLSPVRTARDDERREVAIRRMVKLMKRGIDLGGRKFARDEMHER